MDILTMTITEWNKAGAVFELSSSLVHSPTLTFIHQQTIGPATSLTWHISYVAMVGS